MFAYVCRPGGGKAEAGGVGAALLGARGEPEHGCVGVDAKPGVEYTGGHSSMIQGCPQIPVITYYWAFWSINTAGSVNCSYHPGGEHHGRERAGAEGVAGGAGGVVGGAARAVRGVAHAARVEGLDAGR